MTAATIPLLWALLLSDVCPSGQPWDDYAADAGRDACTGAWLEADTLEPGAADPHVGPGAGIGADGQGETTP